MVTDDLTVASIEKEAMNRFLHNCDSGDRTLYATCDTQILPFPMLGLHLARLRGHPFSLVFVFPTLCEATTSHDFIRQIAGR